MRGLGLEGLGERVRGLEGLGERVRGLRLRLGLGGERVRVRGLGFLSHLSF